MNRHLPNAGRPKPDQSPRRAEPPGIFAGASEEITQEIPRYSEMEPSEPALSMLSRGRHGTA